MSSSIHCWNCSSFYDLMDSSWCGCSPTHPTRICPFCYTCACAAPEDYLLEYRRKLPKELLEERKTLVQPKKKLGELLVEQGKLTQAQLEKLLHLQKVTGTKLGELLVQYGVASQDELSRMLSDQQEMQTIEIEPGKLKASLILQVDPRLCLKFKFVPIDMQEINFTSKLLIIAVAEPLAPGDIERIGSMLDCKVYQKSAPRDQVYDALLRIKKLLLLSMQKQQEQEEQPG